MRESSLRKHSFARLCIKELMQVWSSLNVNSVEMPSTLCLLSRFTKVFIQLISPVNVNSVENPFLAIVNSVHTKDKTEAT